MSELLEEFQKAIKHMQDFSRYISGIESITSDTGTFDSLLAQMKQFNKTLDIVKLKLST